MRSADSLIAGLERLKQNHEYELDEDDLELIEDAIEYIEEVQS